MISKIGISKEVEEGVISDQEGGEEQVQEGTKVEILDQIIGSGDKTDHHINNHSIFKINSL